jgi:hypothetical protein
MPSRNSAPPRRGGGGIPGERGGHEAIGDGEVVAAGPFEAGNLPVVVDLRGRDDHDVALARVLRVAADQRAGGEPFSVTHHAGEGPAAGEPIAAVHRRGGAGRQDGDGGGRNAATGQDLVDRLVREEARGEAHRGGGDHEAPAGRRVDVGQCLDHLELDDRIRLGAPERLGDLQREEP